MKRILSAIILLFSVFVIFIQPIYFGINFYTFWIISSILIIFSIFSGFRDKKLFPVILFFTLIHLTRPINEWFVDLIYMDFPGTFYLIPIITFTGLILIFKSFRKNISWWVLDKIDRVSLLIIIGISLISGLTLFIWGYFLVDDLSVFTNNLPDVSISWILINGIGFAILNSIAEEYLSRGMLCSGLERILKNRSVIIIIQALIFGLFHKNGFPGGLIGIIMVFFWSIALGVIRYRTKGLIGVLIGHFFADFTIYLILYGLK